MLTERFRKLPTIILFLLLSATLIFIPSVRATNLPCTVFDTYYNANRLTEAEVSPVSRRIWHGNGYHWVCCEPAWIGYGHFASSDLTNWINGSDNPVAGRHSFSMTFKGDKAHCADGGGTVVTYAQGTIKNSSISWGNRIYAVANLPQDSVHWVQGTVDSNDIPWIVYAWDGVFLPKSEFGVWVVNATNSTGTEWNEPVRLIQYKGGWWQTQIVPLTDGKVYVTYNRYADSNKFYGQLWNGTDWESREQICTSKQIFSHCITVLNDTVYTVFAADWSELYFTERNPETGWSTPILIATSSHTSEINPAISIDANTGDIYIFWIPYNTNNVYYTRRINGEWDSEPTLWYQEDDTLHSRQISCSLQSYDNIIGVAWIKGENYPNIELRYSYIDLPPVYNIDTGLRYATIQEAIDAPETLDGHTIFVSSGTYYEQVVVNKSVTLIGENKNSTIIDSYAETHSKVAVNVTANNVGISGFTMRNSHPITYSPVWGIWLLSSNNSVHGNIVTSNLGEGIIVRGGNNVISGNTIFNNNYGIAIAGTNNSVTENFISNNEGTGIGCGSLSENCIVRNNVVTFNARGIGLGNCKNATLQGNEMKNNEEYNLKVEGAYTENLEEYNHFIDTSNEVDEKPVYYWINQHDKQIPLDAGYVALINSTRITVKDLNLRDEVLLVGTHECLIENLNISGATRVYFFQSSDNRFENSIVHANIMIAGDLGNNNSLSGLEVQGRISIDVSHGNCICQNTLEGICLWQTRYNVISHNVIIGAEVMGCAIYGYCYLFDNTISSNFISAPGGCAIRLFYGVSRNQIFNNTIANSITGIHFGGYPEGVNDPWTYNNTMFHNNFINNMVHVLIENSKVNTWDDGYPSGGNYWSDYAGVDVKSGPNQDQPSSDGMGDTPYVIDANNIDHYPLMYPWGTPSPPSYTLTVYSSPIGVTFIVDNASRSTPWSGTYSENTSVSLVMPEIHTVGDARYYWDQWSDGVTSRSRTVPMNTNITLTAYFTGPYYELTITSSPITGITFTINGVPETTPYTEWLFEGSYTLEMPETHDGYEWSHWLEDDDTNRVKIITLSGTTWTGVYVPAPPPPAVGGEMILVKVDKPAPPAPTHTHAWIGFLSAIISTVVVSAVYAKHRKRKQP